MAKNQETRSRIVIGDEDTDAGFTQRMLMSMVVDVTCLAENVERVKIQVFALAKENGVYIPREED